MTKNFHNDIIVKKRKGHFFKKLSLFLIFSASLCFVIFLADIISTALTAGQFTFANITKGNIKINEKTLYAVTMGETDDKFTAFNIAGGVSVLGAGGYVWAENGKYYVVANIYDNLKDANQIANELSGKNYTIGVLEINFKKVKLSSDSLTKSQKQEVVQSINRLYKLYDELYDLAINVDTKNISFIQGGSLVNGYKSEFKIISSNLTKLNASINLDYIEKINNCYILNIELLDALVYKLLKDNELNSVVKNTEIELVYNIYGLINSL